MGKQRVITQGWEQVSGATPVDLAMGATSTNNNFVNKAYGNLVVVKNVVDANGQTTADVTDWTWNYDGAEMDGLALSTGSTNVIKVPAGTYSVSENQQANYSVQSSSCSGEANTTLSITQSVVVSPGETVTCTFTNTRDTGALTVKKHVDNNHGGLATAAAFTLHVMRDGVDVAGSSFPGSETGTSFGSLPTGTYTVSEDAPMAGYRQASIVCNGVSTSTVVITKGSQTNCIITNEDIAPQLTVIKTVDNTGTNLTKTASDFTMNVDAINPSQTSFAGSTVGTTITLNQGDYAVTETPSADYKVTYTNCEGEIAVGETKTCTVHNQAILKPAITVEKSGPDTAYEGDTVTYTFTVKNTGNAPFVDYTVVDDIAGEGEYVMGDVNNNGNLDPSETWLFTVDYVIPTPQVADVVNTVKACGFTIFDTEGSKGTCDTDTHTLDVLHPSLSVVKSGPVNAQVGTTGTYTFTVKNTGDTPLAITAVEDDIAGVGTYVSGDMNNNEIMETSETWIFQATYRFTQVGTIKNTVTVCADDDIDAIVCDDDSHETIVYVPQVLGETTTPKLEDTGTSLLVQTILSGLLIVGTIWVATRKDMQAKTKKNQAVMYSAL